MTTKIRKKTSRNVIFGTIQRPRLSVFRSNKGVSVQAIDDENGKTIFAVSYRDIKDEKTRVEVAFKVGELIAKTAKDAKIKTAVFDRNGYRYHGQVKAIAEGIRSGGIEI